jgi:hypothetical protein
MKSLLLLCILSTSSFCFGQRAITGTVSDVDSGLFDAIVLVKGTVINSSTDFDGNYAIAAKTGDVLIFSYPGYDTQEIVVGDQSVINVKLTTELTLVFTVTHYYDKKFEIENEYGFNYQTYGLGIIKEFNYPLDFEVRTFLGSNFMGNKKFEFTIDKPIPITDFYLNVGFIHQQVDFESSHFKKNQLFLKKNFGADRNPFQHIAIVLGHLKFQTQNYNEENLGLGFHLRKRIINNIYISSEYTYWNRVNEIKLQGEYLIKHNWIASFKYQHVNNYEEISIGISRSWGYW